ncbi:MAG TPA: cytochrome c oxidase subunit II [Thermomicrobiales bacterium]|jgi:cytochrome c oxidase subunit 2
MTRRGVVRSAFLTGTALIAVLAITGCSAGPEGLRPISPEGRSIRDLFALVLALSAVVFLGVVAVLAYVLIRYRSRGERGEHGGGGEHPKVQIAWTVGPLLLFAVLAVLFVRTMNVVDHPVAASGLRVEVIGHQWWWEFRYPDLGVVTANELHVPVGTPMRLDLSGADVIHSFWVPQFGWKVDAIPGRPTHLSVTVDRAGTFLGSCTEFCGAEHAGMLIRVVAEPQDQFDAWVKAQQQPAATPQSDVAQSGQNIFLSSTCVSCHTVRGTAATGSVGPDLTHVGSRATLGSGVVTNTPDHLRTWIANAGTIKPAVLMPPFDFTPEQLDALVAYLESLK